MYRHIRTQLKYISQRTLIIEIKIIRLVWNENVAKILEHLTLR